MRTSAKRRSGQLCIAAICLTWALGAGAVSAQEDASTRTNREAYELAMKCFVANGVARGNSRDAGDTAHATAYEAKARESFNVVVNLGNALGYSRKRIDQDFGLAQTQELLKLVADAKYLKRMTVTCKAVGL